MLVGVDRLIDIDRVTVVTDGAAPRLEKRRLKLQKGQRSRRSNWAMDSRCATSTSPTACISARQDPPMLSCGACGLARRPPPLPAPNPRRGGRQRAPQRPRPRRPPRQGERKRTAPGPCSLACMRLARRRMRTSSNLVGDTASSPGYELRALGGTVQLKELRVTYAGGEPDVLAVNGEVGADERTPWLELTGDRFIREIAFVYPAQSRRSKARLEIWGNTPIAGFSRARGAVLLRRPTTAGSISAASPRSLSASGAAWVLKPTSYPLRATAGSGACDWM